MLWYVRATTLVSPGAWRYPVGYYAILAHIFCFYLSQIWLGLELVSYKSRLLAMYFEPFLDDRSPYETHGVVPDVAPTSLGCKP